MNFGADETEGPLPGVKLKSWNPPPEWGAFERVGTGLAGPPDAPSWIKLPVEVLSFPDGRTVLRYLHPIPGCDPL
jgi:hypothetical protein